MRSPLRRIGFPLSLGAGALLLSLGVADAAAQVTGTVRGTVTDATTGRPLDGAQVFVLGTELGSLTSAGGEYQLNVPAGPVELRARRLGYASVTRRFTVTAGETATVDVQMSAAVIGLDAIVVTGAGAETEKRKLGNTVVTIDADALQDAPVTNLSEMLAAREPGISVLPSGGLTGEGARIRIRGAASLSQPNEPIVYVNGVRVDRSGGFGDFIGTGGGGYPSRLDDINPDAIERIEVLKGAAAATLYGTEASAGVIQIFTKQGSRGAPRFDFVTEQGFSRFPAGRYEPEYGWVRTDSLAAVQSDALGIEVPTVAELSAFYGRAVQPFEMLSRNVPAELFETGVSNTFSASVSGGTSTVTYFVNGRYARENGAWGGRDLGPAQDLDYRAQGSASLVLFPTDAVKIRVNAEYIDAHHETPSNNNNIFGTISAALFSRPELAKCFPGSLPTGGGFCTVDGRATSPFGPGNPYGQAAFATVRENMQERIRQDTKHFFGSVNVAYEPVPQLSIEGTLGVDVVNQISSDFARFGYNVDNFIAFDPEGFKFLDNRTRRELTVEAKATWTRRVGEHFLSTLVVGGQGFISKLHDAANGGELFPGPGLEVTGAALNWTAYERFVESVNAGAFLQEQLGYKDFAFLTVGGRYDRNSAFGETSQGVLYPKASISVLPSALPGWSNSAWRANLSTVRLRAAVGQSGLQPQAFSKLTTFEALSSETGPGVGPDNLGNPDLKPEVSTEWELGSEIGAFNDRAALELTYWKRITRDALYFRQFAPSGGFRDPQLSNVARLDAHGWELGLRLLPISSPNLSVRLFANAAFLDQVVTSLGAAPPLKVGGSYPRYRNFVYEAYAPGALFGAKLVQPCSQRPAGASYACLQAGENPYDLNGDGSFDTDAEMLAALASPRGLPSPIRVDEDGDGDFLDHYLGKSTPDWSGSFGLNATILRNFELGSLFEYKFGNYTITNLTFAFRNANPVIGRNSRRAAEVERTMYDPASSAEDRVQAAKDWTKLIALTPYDGLNQNENGKFLRWRELSLAYTVPAEWANAKLGLRYLSLAASVRNLALWTGYTGIDPELNVFGRGAGGLDLGGVDNNFGNAIDAFGLALPLRFTFSVRFGL